MGETRAERLSCSEYFIISQQAAIKSGLDRLQATQDRHLVLTGQSLEANRQALETSRQALEAIRGMGKPTEAPPSGGLKHLWTTAKEWLSGFVLLHRVLVAVRVASLPTAAFTLWSWFGWLVKALVGR